MMRNINMPSFPSLMVQRYEENLYLATIVATIYLTNKNILKGLAIPEKMPIFAGNYMMKKLEVTNNVKQ